MIDSKLIADAISPLSLSSDEFDELARAIAKPPRPSIRVRPSVDPGELPFPVEPVDWHARGHFVADGVRPGATIDFAAGTYFTQDAASLLAIALLDAKPGELICDLCAAPGGKSTAILEDLDDAGWLLSNEAVDSRVGMLTFNLARHGSPRYFVSRFDPDDLASHLPGVFDAVLVDAPCSGQSLLGRGKQTQAAFAPATIAHCAARQSRILSAAAQLVRPGGRLVYSTCTFAFDENEGRIESFLAERPDWQLEPAPQLERWMSEHGGGHYRVWPHRHHCGGAYAAKLRRQPDAIEGCDSSGVPALWRGQLRSESRSDSAARHGRFAGVLRPASWPDGFADWGELIQSVAYRRDLQTFAWPADLDERLLPVAINGPEVGFRKATTWFPSYALAMRRDKRWTPRQTFELDEPSAIKFLQGESLRGPIRGWAVATWQGKPLGWLKGDGLRLKNHLPKQGRVGK